MPYRPAALSSPLGPLQVSDGGHGRQGGACSCHHLVEQVQASADAVMEHQCESIKGSLYPVEHGHNGGEVVGVLCVGSHVVQDGLRVDCRGEQGIPVAHFSSMRSLIRSIKLVLRYESGTVPASTDSMVAKPWYLVDARALCLCFVFHVRFLSRPLERLFRRLE